MPLSVFDADFVWQPDPAAAQQTNLARLMRRYGYGSLHISRHARSRM